MKFPEKCKNSLKILQFLIFAHNHYFQPTIYWYDFSDKHLRLLIFMKQSLNNPAHLLSAFPKLQFNLTFDR